MKIADLILDAPLGWFLLLIMALGLAATILGGGVN
jgi:hypothetical protein